MGTQWDRAIRVVGQPKLGSPLCRVGLPVELSRSLVERGYNRTLIELTPEGILLRPYRTDVRQANDIDHDMVELPETWK